MNDDEGVNVVGVIVKEMKKKMKDGGGSCC